MRGDYSRERFHPDQHFSSVRQQQGRVALDAEWNEYTAIQDRRWRAESQDVIGLCGVPETPADSFAVLESGGELLLGAGRIYVDGLLAENHGAAPFLFAPTLEESYGSAPLPLNAQPYWPEALTPLAVGTHLVYVDVWTRELSHRQLGGLIEPALGVDTTTREQTVWQVRALANIGDDAHCQTALEELPGWQDSNARSGARLTTTTVEVDIQEDPCIIPPSGGYRGLENQLYRVEVHDAPTPDSARIKWSRDNATVSASVREVLPGAEVVRVDQVGKDDFLRFKNGDWAEFINNARELTGKPGEMRQVQVDEGEHTISFSTPLSADLVSDPQASHLRVVRWDQKETVDGDGLILLNDGDAVVLEAGIKVELQILPGHPARTGDYWCFAARAVGTSIEILSAAPPLGVHHHYCRLALIEVSDGGTIRIDDCRPTFTPLTAMQAGCCTVVVRPGENLQAAIDSLPDAGGCVCIKTGEHAIQEPLRIRRSKVSLHGESPGARIVRSNGATLLIVMSDDFSTLNAVAVEGLQFHSEASSEDFEPMVRFRNADDCSLQRCRISSPPLSTNTGVMLSRCESCSVIDNRIENALTAVWAMGDSSLATISGNDIVYQSGSQDRGLFAIWLMDAFGPSRMENNRIEGYLTGIAINAELPNAPDRPRSGARGSVVRGNALRRQQGENSDAQERYYAIDVAAVDCIIENNQVTHSANWHVGIRGSASRIRIENNLLWSTFDARDPDDSPPLAILCAADESSAALSDAVIAGNRLMGEQYGVLAENTIGLQIRENVIRGQGVLTYGIGLQSAIQASVRQNRISAALFGVVLGQKDDISHGCRVENNQLDLCRSGITVFNASDTRIEDNTILLSEQGAINIFATHGALEINNNLLRSSGYGQEVASGAMILIHQGLLRFCGNEVRNTGNHVDGNASLNRALGLRAEMVQECAVERNVFGYDNGMLPDRAGEHRALLLRGLSEAQIFFGDRRVVLGFPAALRDNHFQGPGLSALVEFAELRLNDNLSHRFERVIVSNNCFDHALDVVEKEAATLYIRGSRAICQGNDFKSALPVPPVNFHNVESVYLGNAAMAAPINFTGVPATPGSFNLQ